MSIIKRGFELDKGAFVRSDDSEGDSLGVFHGHAAVFNQEALIGSTRAGFIEFIAPGAFDDVLENDVRFLFNHDGQPLARTTNGTLRLSVDHVGLVDDADIARTSLGNDMITLLNRQDINQQSFAFTIREQMWSSRTLKTADGEQIVDVREITKLDRLYDTSLVTYPAYDGTDAGVRTSVASNNEIEEALRLSGRSDRDVQIMLHDAYAYKRSIDLTATRERSIPRWAR